MKKGITVLTAVVITFIVILAVASAGWFYVDKKWNTEKSDLQNQISEYKSKTDELEAEIETLETKKQSQDEEEEKVIEEKTGDLKTYVSTEYGYSFNYPSSFSLVDWLWDGQNNKKVPQKGKVVWISKTALSDDAIPLNAGPISQYFSVTVEEDNITGLSALRGDGTGVLVTDYTIAGVQGWKVMRTTAEEYSGNFTTSYYVNHNNNVYSLQIVNSDASGTHDAEIDIIVESFKFL